MVAHDALDKPMPMNDTALDIACLCAGWCHLCTDYRAVLRDVAAEWADGPALRWHWIDIEDEADWLGDVDVETFPTLVIAAGRELRFAGPVAPHGDTLRRLLRATLAPAPGGARTVTAAPEFHALAARLAMRATDAL